MRALVGNKGLVRGSCHGVIGIEALTPIRSLSGYNRKSKS